MARNGQWRWLVADPAAAGPPPGDLQALATCYVRKENVVHRMLREPPKAPGIVDMDSTIGDIRTRMRFNIFSV
jgi:hypothetical protein